MAPKVRPHRDTPTGMRALDSSLRHILKHLKRPVDRFPVLDGAAELRLLEVTKLVAERQSPLEFASLACSVLKPAFEFTSPISGGDRAQQLGQCQDQNAHCVVTVADAPRVMPLTDKILCFPLQLTLFQSRYR